MEDNNIDLLMPICKHNLRFVKGVTVIKLNDITTIWLWSENKIAIFESTFLSLDKVKSSGSLSPYVEIDSPSELILETTVIDIFCWMGDEAYALDASGVFYSFKPSDPQAASPMQFMDVDDMFCSPKPNKCSLKWVKKVIKKVENCKRVITASKITSGFAILANKDGAVVIFVYSYPDFTMKVFVDLDKFTPCTGLNNLKSEAISTCSIGLLSPPLKELFQENCESFSSEIIIVGLTSGLVIWFFVSSPSKGPFVLCSNHQPVQGFHWIKDDKNGLFSKLIIVLTSGRFVIFDQKYNKTAYLPDSVKTSCLVQGSLVTSNLIDCYSSIFQTQQEINLNCLLLAVKGVCAMAVSPSSNKIILATVHGSVYCLDPRISHSHDCPNFIIYDPSLLDNMFTQTKFLEKIYQELNKEDDILTAVSVTAAVNNTSNIFEVKITLISDSQFDLSAKLLKTNIVFTHRLWLACVEVCNNQGERETLLCSFKEDFDCSRDLNLCVPLKLSIGVVVSLELVLFLEENLPFVSVLLDKVTINVFHLVSSATVTPNVSSCQRLLSDDILYSQNKLSMDPVKELKKVSVRIPLSLNGFSALKAIMKDSQHEILEDDWLNSTGRGKLDTQICVESTPVQFSLDMENKELTIASLNMEFCLKIKESILEKLATLEKKYIPEHLILDVQALYQAYEIEKLRERINFLAMHALRKSLRCAVSLQLPF